MNRDRILAFNSRPIQPVPKKWQIKRGRSIPQSPERILDAPWLMDDPYLNLLDWGKIGVSIALGNSLFIWNNGSVELITYDDEVGPITSVCWAPDGRNIAIGLNSSDVQIWDVISRRKLRTLKGVHHFRVGSLSWNQQILTTGGKDGKICNTDIRSQTSVMHTYYGHNGEICSLKWSDCGKQLASGGTDNLLHIWNLSMSMPSARDQNQWLHRFEAHIGAVKALAWCPFQSNTLASGGIDNDRSIMIWNTLAGSCLRTVKTGSEVCSLIWNKNEKELLSSHGYRENQLVMWKYPYMVKMGELKGHNSRVLYMAQSPDGTSVMSASAEVGEEKMMIWNLFGDSNSTMPTRGKHLADYNFIR